MKKFNYLALILILGVFIACSDDDDDNSGIPAGGTNDPAGNFIAATIDGQAFSTTNIVSGVDSGTVFVSGFKGTFSNPYPALIINFPDTAIAPVNYTYDAFSGDTTLGLAYVVNDSIFYVMLKGEMQLTKHNRTKNTAEGTFSGIMYDFESLFGPNPDSLVVTNGRFRTSY